MSISASVWPSWTICRRGRISWPRVSASVSARPCGLDHPYNHIDAILASRRPLGQHLKRLADSGRRAKEDLEPAPPLLRRLAQKGLGIGPVVYAHQGRAEFSAAVEREDVHVGITEQRGFDVPCHQLTNLVQRQVA